ncbi:Uu.00g019370.m01.CDS01 [Anthostomella pinea]|uniref:Uu.00g019370.m01.CDS01 n=1 Tax=Anthostomella pinea TaxID=933095 RepID=A0AAI8YQP1_9PEZI|nr:Uu.00g019370.m01.CDS01 [Anthostomella pinea]
MSTQSAPTRVTTSDIDTVMDYAKTGNVTALERKVAELATKHETTAAILLTSRLLNNKGQTVLHLASA